MRRIFLLLISIIVSNCYSQENLTIGEVFDFEINDEFHYEILRRFASYPEGERIIVTDKYYSADSNTVTYKFLRNRYNSDFENYPEPHLVYTFWQDTYSSSYTALDSSIYYLDFWLRYDTLAKYEDVFTYDSIVNYSSRLCNIPINGYFILIGDFEPIHLFCEYGKGIGIAEEWDIDITSGSDGKEGKKLVYYKKTSKSCGTPDLTSVNELKLEQITLFPNPVYDKLNLYINDLNIKETQIQIFDINGIILKTLTKNSTHVIIDLSNYSRGIYLIKILSGNNYIYKKVLKY